MKKVIIGTLLLCFWNADAQELKDQKVSASYLGQTRLQILQDLSEKIGFVLYAKKEEIPRSVPKAQFYKNEPLENVIFRVLSGTNLQFQFTGNSLEVVPIGQPFTQAMIEKMAPEKSNFTISGIIRDKENGESLPFTVVKLKTSDRGSVANVDGYFSLLNVPTDTSTIIVSYVGYADNVLKLNPNMDIENLEVKLSQKGQVLNEVVVQADKSSIQKFSANESISKVTISPSQLSSLPSFGEKDIFKSMQLLPGISGTNEASAGLYVRGGTPDQNLILFDGFTVYHVDHFYGFFSAFNANAVKDIQLYKGGFPAKYGGRISSVVDLTGKNGNTERFSFSGGLSALSANALVEFPFAEGKGSVLVAGRRSYTDIIQSGIYNDIFDLYNDSEDQNQGPGGGFGGRGGGGQFGSTSTEPAFYYYDFNTKVTYRPSSKDIVSFSFYTGRDNLDNSREQDLSGFGGFGGGNTDTEDLTEWGNVGTSLRWGRQWNTRLYSNNIASYSRYFSDRARFTTIDIEEDDGSTRTNNNGNVEDNEVIDYSFRSDNEWKLSRQTNIGFGGQLTFNEISYNYVFNDTINVLQLDDRALTAATYLSGEHRFNAFKVVGGLRGTFYDATDAFYVEPRLSISYDLTERLSLKAATGRFLQFTNRVVREDVTQGSRDFWLLSNGEENPIGEAVHYIAGTAYETENYLFSVEGFYKDLDGISEFTLRFNTPNLSGEVDNNLFFNGTGVARGVEFLVQKKLGSFTGWVGHTLSQVEYDIRDLSDQPYPALHDQTHETKIVGSYELGEKWTFSSTWVYATGKPYTAPIGGYTLTLLDGTEQSYVSVGQKNGFRLPDYHRLDVSVTNHFRWGASWTGDFGLSLYNLYGRQNVWYKEFEIVDDDVLETDVNYLGFTPNLFLNLKF